MNQLGNRGGPVLRGISHHWFVCILFCSSIIVGAVGRTDDAEPSKRDSEPRRIVPENVKDWKITLTVRGGGGLEALRLGWYSVEIPTEGSATVRKHHSVDVSDEYAIANPNAVVIFRDTLTAEQRTAVFRAAAASTNNFELKRNIPGGTVSEDGWRVTLKIATPRREVSVSARDLTNVRDAGDDFPRLIEEINKFLPAKSPIKFQ